MDDHRRLAERVGVVLREQGTPEPHEEKAERFAWHVKRVRQWQRWWPGQIAAHQELGAMDILRLSAEAKCAGDLDEAFWRGFLAAHFGRPSVDPRDDVRRIESAGRMLCGFGAAPMWTWRAVSSDLPGFAIWLQDHRAQLAELRFGNHRKYESKQPGRLLLVIDGFVEWVDRSGGTPQHAFSTAGAPPPEAAFDTLYHRLRGLHRFGRTARFDLLLLLSDMGLLAARPGSCYLDGATGPVRGARKLWGDLSTAELERRADELARRVRLPFELVEDALCVWQKKPPMGS